MPHFRWISRENDLNKNASQNSTDIHMFINYHQLSYSTIITMLVGIIPYNGWVVNIWRRFFLIWSQRKPGWRPIRGRDDAFKTWKRTGRTEPRIAPAHGCRSGRSVGGFRWMVSAFILTRSYKYHWNHISSPTCFLELLLGDVKPKQTYWSSGIVPNEIQRSNSL